LRRAFGFKRSEARMREVEVKLRRGMEANGITGPTQDIIVQSITSFALYGFPESHAASFALLAYASAYLRCRYIAAFTCALLNNQPMGFYHPSTIVQDAQRHGLRVLPVDVTQSEWKCAVTPQQSFALRLGLNYVRGLRKSTGDAIVAARAQQPFTNIQELVRRVPEISKEELRDLAEIGALNFIDGARQSHRRDALWHSEAALRETGPLLEWLQPDAEASPLAAMTREERVTADFRGTGLTVGRHPMALRRDELAQRGVLSATELKRSRDGEWVRIAGSVICRQRPGTAKGFVFLSLEDETGISNAIVTPDLFDANKLVLVSAPYLLVEGILQNQQGVVSVRARRFEALTFAQPVIQSKDFS